MHRLRILLIFLCIAYGGIPLVHAQTSKMLLTPAEQKVIMANKIHLLETNECKNCDLRGLSFDDEYLSGADLSGANLESSTFSQIEMINANLNGANLNGAILEDIELMGSNLKNASLKNAFLEDVELDDANLSNSNLEAATFIDGSFTEANFTETNLKEAIFRLVDLVKTDFSYADLQGAMCFLCSLDRVRFIEANLRDTEFHRTDFTRTDFYKANLDSVIIHRGTWSEANFDEASIRNARIINIHADELSAFKTDFSQSKLVGFYFGNADLQQSHWTGTKVLLGNFRGADFSEAQMETIDFQGVNMRYANFTQANLKQSQMHVANLSDALFIESDLSDATLAIGLLNRANFEAAFIENVTIKFLGLEGSIWIDGISRIPKDLAPSDFDITPESLKLSVDLLFQALVDYSEELLTMLTTTLPENNLIVGPAILLILIGSLPFFYYLRRKENLLAHVGLMLIVLGIELSLFTEFMIQFLELGYLWEVLALSLACFMPGVICGFGDSLFGGANRKKVRRLWGLHLLLTLGWIGATIYFHSVDNKNILAALKLSQALIMVLFLTAYTILPLFTVLHGFFRGNPDARIVGFTLILAGTLSASSPFMEENLAFQAVMLGWLIFFFSPSIIIFRRSISLQKKMEHYSKELQAQSKHLQHQNQELSRLDQLKDEFLANTTHELKTPLNGVIGITESMLDGVTGDLSDPQRQHLAMISMSSRRLANLVNDLLDFSQLKHKSIELQTKSVDLKTMGDLILTLSKPLIANKATVLTNSISSKCPVVLADENRLQQIFHNLVGNAIKFTSKGKIILNAKVQKKMIEVSVKDTGIGIAPEKLDDIFKSFEQADGSTAREYGGTGLGLAITKQLVELHGGRIWVESTPQKGSSFFFTLPISTGKASSSQTNDQPLSSLTRTLVEDLPEVLIQDIPTVSTGNEGNNHFHILAVDDEPINLQVLTNHLQLNNYQVTRATSGSEALTLLENQSFDLVLLDVMMPKMTGYELCQKIREKHPSHQLPILFLTAKNQVTELVTGFSVGGNDFLTKPISKNELIPRVNTHIQLSKINVAYSRFVPEAFLELLKKDNIIEVKLGDHVKREMTVMFADIRSFTSLSEALSPEENFRFINSYLRQMEPVILSHNGVIDKYIGDAVMALFATPDEAVKAGSEMLKVLEEYNHQRHEAGYLPIQIGIGINTGDLMLGTIGGETRMDGTVISDAVNLAARLEGVTKFYKTPLLISQHTYQKLGDKGITCVRYVDQVRVKGKQELISIYEVYGSDPPPQRDAKLFIQERYLQAVAAFQQESWEQAASLFEACLADLPDDHVLEMYLQRCHEMPKTVTLRENFS